MADGVLVFNSLPIHKATSFKGGLVMNIELTDKDFRYLIDLVYVGNWVLNSTRGSDRFTEYDLLQEKIFAKALDEGFTAVAREFTNKVLPSRAYEQGGIHEAIADYEDAIFFEILAEELARRDMNSEAINPENITELALRIEEYISEFEKNGIENINVDL